MFNTFLKPLPSCSPAFAQLLHLHTPCTAGAGAALCPACLSLLSCSVDCGSSSLSPLLSSLYHLPGLASLPVENAQTLAPVPKLSLSHNHWVPGAQGLSAAGIPLGSHAELPDRAQQLLAHPSVSSCFDWPSSRSPDRRNLRIKQFSSCHHAPAEHFAGELLWLSDAWGGSYLGSWRALFRSGVTVAMWLCHECVRYFQDFYWTHFPWTGDRWWRTEDRASPVKRLHEPEGFGGRETT